MLVSVSNYLFWKTWKIVWKELSNLAEIQCWNEQIMRLIKSVILIELVTLIGVYLLFSVKHDMLGVCLVWMTSSALCLPVSQCGNRKIFSLIKISWNQLLSNFFSKRKPLLSRDFCQKSLRENFCNFYTVPHTVEISEFHCHGFFSKIPSNQRFLIYYKLIWRKKICMAVHCVHLRNLSSKVGVEMIWRIFC